MLQTMELPFITKVLIPKSRDHIVRRGRLLDPMKTNLNKKAQVVWAPAGYGKTALLSEFARELELPLFWYSFTPEDYDPVSFLRYCVHAVRSVFPNFGAPYLPHLGNGLDIDWHTQFGLFISSLLNDIYGQVVFIFDDLHWIQGKRELEEALSLLIQRAPPNVHFVLGSRVWPSLSCLPKLVAGNELVWLNARDLRFSTDETVELMTRLRGCPVSSQEGNEVNQGTGGWAAAIMLTTPGQRLPGQTNEAGPVDEGMLFNYLSEEVFDQLASPLQSFLLQSSILREFTVSLCDRLLGGPGSQALIDQVKDRGLFLEERAGKGAAYAYHDLFRNYLAVRFQSERPEEYKRLNLVAGALYAEFGDHDAAIFHFLNGGASHQAIGIVKQVASSYFAQGRWQKLASWLGSLPQPAIAQDPELLLLGAQVQLRLGNPTNSLEQLDHLISGTHASNQMVLGQALVAKSAAYRRLGHLDLAVQAASEGLSILKSIDSPQGHIAEAHKQLGDAFYTRGEYDKAKEHLQTALERAGKENLRLLSLVHNDLGITHMELGELDKAAFYLKKARSGLLKLGSDGPLAETLNNLALVYFHRGEFDLALDEVVEALRTSQGAGYPRVVANALMNQGMIQQALGAHNDSLASASHALEMSQQLLDQRLIAESTETLGSAYRKLGETSKAEVLLKQALLESEESGQKYVAAIYHISLGKLYCQQGSYPQAMEHLRLADAQLTELESRRRLAEIRLYQAAIYYRISKIKDTMEYLTQVADLVSKVGYDGFLLADGGEVLDVLRFGAAKRVGGEAFTDLVGKLAQSPYPEESSIVTSFRTRRLSSFPVLRVFGFGNSRVVLDIHEVADSEWRSRKAKELFFFLLCNRQVLSNEEIMESLWPDVSLDLSGSALKTNIYRLRQALFYDCIVAKDSGYCINPNVQIDFDKESFLQNLKSAAGRERDNEVRGGYLAKAAELYQGPFLSGFNSEWCHDLRLDLELKYHTVLMNLAGYYASRKTYLRAVELLEEVVKEDPYNEEAQYQLIEGYLNVTEPFAALQQLRSYSRVCLEELGDDLSPRFVECHRRILKAMPKSAA
jgi:LuxR family transcriptional regulator, maltose regulon positive regulatory protein